ncbi:hypothetical protein SDIAM26S_01710 [Streptomyces diastaticus subsp. diastaticus]
MPGWRSRAAVRRSRPAPGADDDQLGGAAGLDQGGPGPGAEQTAFDLDLRIAGLPSGECLGEQALLVLLEAVQVGDEGHGFAGVAVGGLGPVAPGVQGDERRGTAGGGGEGEADGAVGLRGAVEAEDDGALRVGPSAQDQDGALAVGGEVDGGGAEEEAAEPAQAPAGDDGEDRVAGLRGEDGEGFPGDEFGVGLQAGHGGLGAGDGFVEEGPGLVEEAALGGAERGGGELDVEHRPDEGVDDAQRAAPVGRLAGGGGDRVEALLGAVDADEYGPGHAVLLGARCPVGGRWAGWGMGTSFVPALPRARGRAPGRWSLGAGPSSFRGVWRGPVAGRRAARGGAGRRVDTDPS